MRWARLGAGGFLGFCVAAGAAAGAPLEAYGQLPTLDKLAISPGEDHWLSRSGTRLQRLQAMAAFLEQTNPPN